ncbi:MAG: hypothetical protein KO202_05545 [Methanobacteriaceae archaeon]|jgi:hypothetical protein|nr:hypothetical protein [Methanobacteriaceae archaeon]
MEKNYNISFGRKGLDDNSSKQVIKIIKKSRPKGIGTLLNSENSENLNISIDFKVEGLNYTGIHMALKEIKNEINELGYDNQLNEYPQ